MVLHPRVRTALPALFAALTCLHLTTPAHGHWCNTLWQSAYNVVVRPEVDAVDVPASGSTSLVIWVQNNMGYPLYNFDFVAVTATGFTISAQLDASTRTVASYLMPGEKQKYTLTISRNGGTTLQAVNLQFNMSFGTSSSQWGDYGTSSYGRDAVVRLSDGTLSSLTNLGNAGGQAVHLGSGARADYGTLATGLDALLNEYCVGRARWNCGSITDVTCGAQATGSPNNYDFEHLWSAEFLAARKAGYSSTPARLDTFRSRLVCGYNDTHPAFHHLAIFLLGYLGESTIARNHIEDRVTSATGTDQAIAKAALLLLGNSADYSTHHAAVVSGLGSTDQWVRLYSAASLGLVDLNDSAVSDHLISAARWQQPEATNSGYAFSAAHLLDLITWDRRGWATGSDDSGCGGYYRGCDTTPPAAPANVSCTPGSGGAARIQWDQVTSEPVSRYWVYWGDQQRTGGCLRPGTCTVDYTNSNNTTSIYYDVSGLTQGQRYYFAISAVDAAGNFSNYSVEVPCDIPLTPEPPVAALSCTPTSGTAPLDISCDGTASSDPNNDIAHRYFSLDGGAEVDDADGRRDYLDLAAGNHSVTLRVVDSGGREDSATVSIQVNAPVNHAPTIVASAAPLTGPAPLTVAFDASGSSDPDGDSIAFAWSFGDGSGPSNQSSVSHTFNQPGRYNVTLTVTDNRTPALSSTQSWSINATNQAPVAALDCTPTSGAAPLTVSCDATASSDPNGAADIAAIAFDLDGQGWADDGDGVISFDFATAGSHSIAVRVTDRSGATSTATVPIQVTGGGNLPPTATISVDQASGLAPLSVSFDGTASHDDDGAIVSHEWNFGDGSAHETSDTAQHVFSAGEYTVTLTVTDDGGLTGIATVTISATATQHVPSAALVCSPASGSEPLDVSCDATGSSDSGNDIAHYYFRLNTGSETDEADGILDCADLAAGNFAVSVRVVDGLGAEDVASASIAVSAAVNRAPTAIANADVVSGPAPLTVQFNSAGSSDPDADPIAFEWDFADSSTLDHTAAPSHTFAADGSYRVTLTVTDDGTPALSGTAVLVVTVGTETNRAPDVSTASATPLFGPAPLLVTFDGSGVRDPDGDAVTLTWDFGDSSPVSHQPSVSHSYDHDGEFFAMLTAGDDRQPPALTTRQFRIAVTDNRPPDVETARVTPLTGPAPLTVDFDATPCADPDGDAISYRWSITIDTTEAITTDSPTAQHTFAEPGQYDANITLTDNGTPPLAVSKHFTVVVGYPDAPTTPDVVELLPDGCACTAETPPTPAIALGAAALFALLRVRRRGN